MPLLFECSHAQLTCKVALLCKRSLTFQIPIRLSSGLRKQRRWQVCASAPKQELTTLCHTIQQGYYEVRSVLQTRLPARVTFMQRILLANLSTANFCVQLCVENAGRPAAAALAEVVRAAACAFKDGHSMDRLRLEVEHGGLNEVTLSSGACCLTETDKQYRRQFLDTVSICCC